MSSIKPRALVTGPLQNSYMNGLLNIMTSIPTYTIIQADGLYPVRYAGQLASPRETVLLTNRAVGRHSRAKDLY